MRYTRPRPIATPELSSSESPKALEPDAKGSGPTEPEILHQNQFKPDSSFDVNQSLPSAVTEEANDLREYYARYLKKKYPEKNEGEIEKIVDFDIQSLYFLRALQGMKEFDDRIREKYPDLEWTTWFDND